MNKLLLIVLIGSSNFAFSQQKNEQSLRHLTIADSVSAKGIDHATLSINKKRYYTTNGSGSVDINKTLISQKDSISVSSISYKSVVLRQSINAKFPDTIKLSQSVNLLKEVKINSSALVNITLEGPNKSHGSHMHLYPNGEAAQYIPNEGQVTGTITSVEFELNDDLHAIEKPFNVEILSRSKDEIFPDTALITDSIIVYNTKKKRRFSVDISRYHIQIPENGFFVVFQTLAPLLLQQRNNMV
ncbi:MAG: hypothetical protein JWP37_2017 [Mucilaginibacter sp.]|nr:hypothetical protein [Mucilaginibacter sp.]